MARTFRMRDYGVGRTKLRIIDGFVDFLLSGSLRDANEQRLSLLDERRERTMIGMTRKAGQRKDCSLAREGSACFVAVQRLLATGKIRNDERVVIFNTGSGIKYLDRYGAS